VPEVPEVRRRAVVAVSAAAAALLVLSGCSSDPASDTAASQAASSPAPESSPTSSSGVVLKPFEVLPDSELAAMPDFAYVEQEGQDDQVAAQGRKESINLAFQGAVARQLLYKGQEVGGIQMWRFRDGTSVSAQVQLLTFMVGGFGGKEATTGTLNGVPVAVVENAQGSQIAGVGFLTGTDMILVWSQGTQAAQSLAVAYMAAAGVRGVVTESPSPSAS